MLSNPSVIAALLFRLGCSEIAIVRFVSRWILLTTFSCDVGPGARLVGPIDFPHPIGIVIGSGVEIVGRTRIYQNVTIGSSRKGEYPKILEDVVIYSNAVVAGNVVVNQGTTVGANVLLTRSTVAGETVRNGS